MIIIPPFPFPSNIKALVLYYGGCVKAMRSLFLMTCFFFFPDPFFSPGLLVDRVSILDYAAFRSFLVDVPLSDFAVVLLGSLG